MSESYLLDTDVWISFLNGDENGGSGNGDLGGTNRKITKIL